MKISANIFFGLAICLFLATITAAQTDVVIAIDLSKSMEQNDKDGYRFTGAAVALTTLAFYTGNNRGGVVSFGDATSDVVPLQYLSADQSVNFESKLKGLGSEGYTELGKGLSRSQGVLGSSGRKASIILISDGKVEGNPNTRGVSAERAKQQAEGELWSTIIPGLRAARISVYTIGLFEPNRGDEKTLQRIAAETGGFYTHVQNPQEFPQIYTRMLDDIGQPSGVSELTSSQNSIVLTPFDQGVIVLGPMGLVLRAPNGIQYSTDKQTADSPVKQKVFVYSNNTAILFLGRPENIEQNGQFWNGKWVVQFREPNERARATYISNVRLVRDSAVPHRPQYFLNEYYPIQYEFQTPGFDAEPILSKCKVEYIFAPQGQSTAKPMGGAITRQGNFFTAESPLNKEGDFIFEIRVSYLDGEVVRWSKQDHFHVSNISLVTLLGPAGPGKVGSGFRVEAQDGPISTAGYREIKGLMDNSMTFSLRYGTDDSISLPPASADSGVYRSDELEFQKSGDLEIQGVLNGKLLMQLPGPNGEDILKPYNVKARVLRRITIEGNPLQQLYHASLGLATLLGTLLTAYGVLMQVRYNHHFKKAALVGPGTIDLEAKSASASKKFSRLFRWNPAVTIGGPDSSADIKDARLGNISDKVAVEIGVDLRGNYYIVSKGAVDVYLNNSVLEPNIPQPINPSDKVSIENVGSFTFDN